MAMLPKYLSPPFCLFLHLGDKLVLLSRLHLPKFLDKFDLLELIRPLLHLVHVVEENVLLLLQS